MTQLANFFRSPQYERALLKYADVARMRNWQIKNKLEMYNWAKEAFNSDFSEDRKRKAFDKIYENFRRYWQVFRNPRGGCWSADETFDALSRCRTLSRERGMTLLTLYPDSDESRAVLAGLESLRDLKRTQGYPCMPVAKFTHFFNPMLFPIYDYAVIWKKVLDGEFRADFRKWCTTIRGYPRTDIDSVRLNLNYTLLAGDMIRRADDGFMEFFSHWFRQQVPGESDEYRVLDDVKSYYATAFEFVAIGAAELCKSAASHPEEAMP